MTEDKIAKILFNQKLKKALSKKKTKDDEKKKDIKEIKQLLAVIAACLLSSNAGEIEFPSEYYDLIDKVTEEIK